MHLVSIHGHVTHTETYEKSLSTDAVFSYVVCVGDEHFSRSHTDLRLRSDIYCGISPLFFPPLRAQCIPVLRGLDICHISKESKLGYGSHLNSIFMSNNHQTTTTNLKSIFSHPALTLAFANLKGIVYTARLNQAVALLNPPGRQSSHW